MIADVTPPELRGRAFGFHRAADHGGAVLGSLAAWWFLRQGVDVRQVIAWSAMPGVVVLGVLAVVLFGMKRREVERREMERREGAPAAVPPAALSPAASPPAALSPTILSLAALVLARLPEALLLLRLQQLGVAVAAIPLLWAALHVVRSAGSYPGGWLADRAGPRLTVAAGGLLFAAVMAALALPLAPRVAAAVFLALGLVAGLTESAERMLVARLSAARLGRGFGAYHAVTGLAALPAGVFFGVLYSTRGAPAAFVTATAAGLLAVAVWLVVSTRALTSDAIRA
jgi:MFS family permease